MNNFFLFSFSTLTCFSLCFYLFLVAVFLVCTSCWCCSFWLGICLFRRIFVNFMKFLNNLTKSFVRFNFCHVFKFILLVFYVNWWTFAEKTSKYFLRWEKFLPPFCKKILIKNDRYCNNHQNCQFIYLTTINALLTS